MAKWADFCITCKRMNAKGTHIDSVQAMPDLDTAFGTPTTKTRAQVVADLKIGVTYMTVYKDAANKWQPGEKVIIEVVNNVEYIKTIPNKTERDNLDKLPDC